MRLAFSNIAWNVEQEDEIADLIVKHGIKAVEIAPTKYFAAPCSPTVAEIEKCRGAWTQRGISVVACQSLLFQMTHLNILGGISLEAEQIQRDTVEYLSEIMRIGAELGAQRFVFGSPRNRDRAGLDDATTLHRAIVGFSHLAKHASSQDVVFCIEPNPVQYQCNFLTTAAEALSMVEQVNLPGLGLHLDSGIMLLNQEDPGETIENGFTWLRHFHISEPNLMPIGQQNVDHASIAKTLRRLDYQGYVSVEMRGGATSSESYENVERACQVLAEHYV